MHLWRSAVLHAVEKRQPPVFCVHYATDGPRRENQPVSVMGLAVRVIGLEQTKVFSLDMMAEREGIQVEKIPECQLQLEGLLMTEFSCYLERMQAKYPDTWWFHWSMRDTSFGWPMLEHRSQTLLKNSLAINEERLVDLQAHLAKEYGREFVPRPQLLALAQLNGMQHPEMLTGQEEQETLRIGGYSRVSRSTAKKAEALGHLLVRYVEGRLRTLVKGRQRSRFMKGNAGTVPQELVDTATAAGFCGVSRSTWYRMMAGKRVPEPHKLGRRTLWDVRELRRWIDEKCPKQPR